jgi:hypothetical protein
VTNPHPDSEDSQSVNYMVKYDASDNDFYVFVAPTTNTAESVTFATTGGYSGSIADDQPETNTNGTITSSNGSFTVSFTGQTDVHVLTIPNS